jgi:hypothetical protein
MTERPCELRPVRRYRQTMPAVETWPAPMIAPPANERQALPGFSTWQPYRSPDTESDVVVPLLQAAVSAAAGGLVVGAVALFLGAGFVQSVRLAGLAGALVLAGAWLWRLGAATRTLAGIERVTGRDMNGDGAIGRPGVALVNPGRARAEAGRAAQDDQAARNRGELLAFTRRCYAAGTSERQQGIAPGERAAYTTHRDALLALGVARWRSPGSPRAGWVMTVPEAQASELVGRHVL